MLSQQQRINQSLIEDGIPPNDVTQLLKSYSEGEFDGKIGLKALYPENADYYWGWAIGHRIYECQKRGIDLPDDF